METLAKQMSSLVLKQLPESGQSGELTLHVKDAVDVMLDMLDEQRGRSNMPRASLRIRRYTGRTVIDPSAPESTFSSCNATVIIFAAATTPSATTAEAEKSETSICQPRRPRVRFPATRPAVGWSKLVPRTSTSTFSHFSFWVQFAITVDAFVLAATASEKYFTIAT
jgi:hypothetical protein